MAEPIGALHAHLSAGHAQFAADMGKAREAVRTNAARMSREMNKVGTSFASATTALHKFAGLALAAGVASFAALAKSAINAADEIGKTAPAIGATTESLSTLAFAAKLNNVELAALTQSLRILSTNAVQAAQGTGEARFAFDGLGITLIDATGKVKGADALLRELAERFQGLEDGAEKTALAVQLFGRSGADLIPLLNQGAAGLAELEARARELGAEIDQETALAAARFNDQLTELKVSLNTMGRELAMRALPYLSELADAFTTAYREGGLLAATWRSLATLNKQIGGGEIGKAERRLKFWQALQKQVNMLAWPVKNVQAFQRQIEDAQHALGELRLQQWLAEDEAKEQWTAEQQRLAEEAAARATRSRELSEQMRLAREREAAERRAAAEEAERQRRGEQQIQNLQREIDLYGQQTRLQRVAWEIEQGNLADLNVAHQEQLLVLAAQLDALEAVTRAEAEALAQREAGQRRAQHLLDQTLTQEERHLRQVAELNTLLAAGLLTTEEYFRVYWHLKDAMAETVEAGIERFTELEHAFQRWTHNASAMLADWATGGKATFADFVNSVLRDLMRIQIQQYLMGPLFSSLGGSFGMNVPHRATGGPVGARRVYEVNERGPELLSTGNRHFLMMAGQSGQVQPLEAAEATAAPDRSSGVRIVNLLDPALVNDWASSAAGERTIVNVIARHATQLRAMLS